MLFAAIFLTLPLTEMYATVGSAIVCDCLRLYGNNSLCDRLRSAIRDPRSSAIVCDHMETRFKVKNKLRFSKRTNSDCKKNKLQLLKNKLRFSKKEKKQTNSD